MLARFAWSDGTPLFMVRDAILIPGRQARVSKGGWELSTEAILSVVNAAIRSGDALIEVHNHGGRTPRFSPTDLEGLREFPAYVLSSIPGRPYGATVWGDHLVYGEFFASDGRCRGCGPDRTLRARGRQSPRALICFSPPLVSPSPVTRFSSKSLDHTCGRRAAPW